MRTLALAAIALLSALPASAQSAFPDDATLLATIKNGVEDGRAAGIVLGVMDKDRSTRVVAYGDSGPGAKPLSADSIFEIGSVTKTFTATILADMVMKDEVKLDVPAQTYAPEGLTLPKHDGKQITLANLSEQNSGLPRLPFNLAPKDITNPYADYTVEQLYAFLSSYKLTRDPGEQYEYSNLGVGLLGRLLAARAGENYEALVTERVLAPLHMTSTGITLTPEMQANLAWGHNRKGDVVSNWDLPVLAGAGALRSSMTDMLKYLDANLGEPETDLERAMRLAQQPRAKASGKNEIGLNWIIIPTASGKIVAHDGGTGGYGAFIAFDPEREIGVVLLSNSANVPADIAMRLLDPLKTP